MNSSRYAGIIDWWTPFILLKRLFTRDQYDSMFCVHTCGRVDEVQWVVHCVVCTDRLQLLYSPVRCPLIAVDH